MQKKKSKSIDNFEKYHELSPSVSKAKNKKLMPKNLSMNQGINNVKMV